MRNDDPKFLKAQKAAAEQMRYVDALSLSITKGHRIMEMAIDEVLPLFTPKKRWWFFLVKPVRGFKSRARRCMKYIKAPEAAETWDVLWAADSLRNELSHERDMNKINAKMAKLRKLYLKTLSEGNKRGIDAVADETLAHQACFSVAGFLYAQADAEKRRRKEASA